ncbi:MAG: hypothetical protein RIC95_09395 [Vicingaceae bacterium]
MEQDDKVWEQMIKDGWNEEISMLTYAKILRHVKKWNNFNISDEEAHLNVKNIIAICNIVGCHWDK